MIYLARIFCTLFLSSLLMNSLFSQERYLNFDGVNDFVRVLDTEALQLSGNLTVSIKFKDDIPTSNQGFAMVSKQCGDASPQSEGNCTAGAFGWMCGFADGSIFSTLNEPQSSDTYYATGNYTENDEWNYGTFTIGSYINGQNSMAVYINGSLVNSTSIPAVDPAAQVFADLIIGSDRNGDPFFTGKISEITLWDIALSDEQINNIENTIEVNEGNLVAYYKFNAGTGEVLYDYSGNNHHGIIEGATWGRDINTLIVDGGDLEYQENLVADLSNYQLGTPLLDASIVTYVEAYPFDISDFVDENSIDVVIFPHNAPIVHWSWMDIVPDLDDFMRDSGGEVIFMGENSYEFIETGGWPDYSTDYISEEEEEGWFSGLYAEDAASCCGIASYNLHCVLGTEYEGVFLNDHPVMQNIYYYNEPDADCKTYIGEPVKYGFSDDVSLDENFFSFYAWGGNNGYNPGPGPYDMVFGRDIGDGHLIFFGEKSLYNDAQYTGIQNLLGNIIHHFNPVPISGCTDSSACNYDPEATADNGDCLYNDCAGECGGDAIIDECGTCSSDVLGGTSASVDINFSYSGSGGYHNEGIKLITHNGFEECYYHGQGLSFSDLSSCDISESFNEVGNGTVVRDAIMNLINSHSSNFHSVPLPNDPSDNEMIVSTIQTGEITNSSIVIVSNYSIAAGLFLINNEWVESGNFSGGTSSDYECAEGCDGNWYDDGNAPIIDECGECGGDGIDPGECDCDHNVLDCAGECGGTAELDCNMNCNGDWVSDTLGNCCNPESTDQCGTCYGNDYDWCDDDGDGISNIEDWGYAAHSINAVDVSGDQGGNVHISFSKSFYDTDSLRNLEAYTIERNDSDYWTALLTISAYGSDIYHGQVQTLQDSTSLSDGMTEFRVISSMEEGNFESFEDENGWGYSVDNILPTTPEDLMASGAGDDVNISWSYAPEFDFNYHQISELYSSLSYTTENHISMPVEAYNEYFVNSVDVNGNLSDRSEYVGAHNLHYGPNLVSFSVLPEDTSPESVLVIDEVGGILGEGVASQELPNGTWVGSLSEISADNGYWVKADDAVVLPVVGNKIVVTDFNLHFGANLIGYSCSNYGAPQDLIDNDHVYAIIGEGIAAQNLNGMWVGSLSNLGPGKGYWFKTDEDTELSYDCPNTEISSREYVEPAYKDYAQSIEQAFYFFEDIDGIEVGDRVEAYSGSELVGSRVWSGPYTDVPAMGRDDQLVTQNYCTTGSIPEFKVVKTSGEILELTGTVPVWESNGIFTVSDMQTELLTPESFSLSSAYPNPFNPSTTINFTVPYISKVILEVYDINGRNILELASGNYNPGYHSITWDASGYSSGMYFVRMVTEGFSSTQKVMLVK